MVQKLLDWWKFGFWFEWEPKNCLKGKQTVLLMRYMLVCDLSSWYVRPFCRKISVSLKVSTEIVMDASSKVITVTAWKVSKHRVFCGPYSVQLQENTDQKKTPYLDTFQAVCILIIIYLKELMQIFSFSFRYSFTPIL